MDKPRPELIAEIADLLNGATGVQLGRGQSNLIQARLQKRLHALRLRTWDEYHDYLRQNPDCELAALVSLLTTHHTYFFREFHHFEHLLRESLPALAPIVAARPDRCLRVWSAACSYGHEVYSLAMFLEEHWPQIAPGCTFSILGTDVDPESVETARKGVYLWNELNKSPAAYLQGRWLRGTGEISPYAKPQASLKRHCHFDVGNLLEAGRLAVGTFDLIWCRNVFIYFTPEQIGRSSAGLLQHLEPDGYFYIGLSESLNGLDLPVEHAGPSVYRRAGKTRPPLSQATAPLRVFCVDDSPTILALLKKVLTRDHGFEIVGTAPDGLEAQKQMAVLSGQVDVMTLDLQMPRLDGLGYLRGLGHKAHPPVVMLSSVARADADLAQKALELGAVDYVEKPSLASLETEAPELRAKLFTAKLLGQRRAARSSPRLDGAFAEKRLRPEARHSLRVVIATMADLKSLLELLQSEGTHDSRPPLLILSLGAAPLLGSLLEKNGLAPKSWPAESLQENEIYLGTFPQALREATAKARTESRRCSFIALAGAALLPAVQAQIRLQTERHLLEESPGLFATLPAEIQNRVRLLPAPSLLYHSDEDLRKAA